MSLEGRRAPPVGPGGGADAAAPATHAAAASSWPLLAPAAGLVAVAVVVTLAWSPAEAPREVADSVPVVRESDVSSSELGSSPPRARDREAGSILVPETVDDARSPVLSDASSDLPRDALVLRARDAAGAPVHDLEVRALDAYGEPGKSDRPVDDYLLIPSDSDDVWSTTWEALEPHVLAGRVNLYVRAPGRAWAYFTADASTLGEFELELFEEATLDLRVLLPDDASEARLKVGARSPVDLTRHAAVDADGARRITLTGLPPGPTTLTVVCAHRRPVTLVERSVELGVGPNEVEDLVVPRETPSGPDAPITGTIEVPIDASAIPAAVHLRAVGGHARHVGQRPVTVDVAGLGDALEHSVRVPWSSPALPVGTYVVRLDPFGLVAEVEIPTEEPLAFVVEDVSHVRVEVFDVDSEERVPVRKLRASPADLAATAANTTVVLPLDGAPPGTFLLPRATRETLLVAMLLGGRGEPVWEGALEFTPARGSDRVVLPVRKQPVLAIHLMDGDAGVPWGYQDVLVSVERLDGSRDAYRDRLQRQGMIQFEEAGWYRLTLDVRPGYVDPAPFEIEVPHGDPVVHELHLVRAR